MVFQCWAQPAALLTRYVHISNLDPPPLDPPRERQRDAAAAAAAAQKSRPSVVCGPLTFREGTKEGTIVSRHVERRRSFGATSFASFLQCGLRYIPQTSLLKPCVYGRTRWTKISIAHEQTRSRQKKRRLVFLLFSQQHNKTTTSKMSSGIWNMRKALKSGRSWRASSRRIVAAAAVDVDDEVMSPQGDDERSFSMPSVQVTSAAAADDSSVASSWIEDFQCLPESQPVIPDGCCPLCGIQLYEEVVEESSPTSTSSSRKKKRLVAFFTSSFFSPQTKTPTVSPIEGRLCSDTGDCLNCKSLFLLDDGPSTFQEGGVEVYIGDYNEYGQRHGEGELLWKDGSRYEGSFFNGLLDGTGCLYFADGKSDSHYFYNFLSTS